MSSIPGTSSGSSLHYTAWNRRPPCIYLRGNKVVHSVSLEFPPGSEMTPEQIESAKARGYVIMMVTESTITQDIETQPASGGKVKKRIPQDPFILLNEIDVDKLSGEQLSRYINLCDFYLEHYEEVLDPDTEKILEWFDIYDLDIVETQLANTTPLSKKLASARRYRNRRQHILNKKKQAQANKINKVIAKKMAFSQKTRTGQDKKKYHVNESNFHKGYSPYCSYADFLDYNYNPERPSDKYQVIFEIDCKRYTGLTINGVLYEGQELFKRLEFDLTNSILTEKPIHYYIGDNKIVEVRDLIRSVK